MSKADAGTLDNPQLAHRATMSQRSRQTPDVGDDRCLVLMFESQNDHAGVFVRRICLNVREVQIEGDQNAVFKPGGVCNIGIVGTGEVFLAHGVGAEPRITQDFGCFDGQVLVDLKSHVVSSAGSSMTPSRASSAA